MMDALGVLILFLGFIGLWGFVVAVKQLFTPGVMTQDFDDEAEGEYDDDDDL
jgi:hypothetical protein